MTRDEARTWAETLRAEAKTLVFTNGVFDLLHPGHVRYLQEARRLGDALIVAVNSDRSARGLDKGPDRPLNRAMERAEVLAALECVDATVIFDDPTPLEIITELQPDVLVKGADWAVGTIVGADVVEGRGGRVVRIPMTEGFSTTTLIEKVRGKDAGPRGPMQTPRL